MVKMIGASLTVHGMKRTRAFRHGVFFASTSLQLFHATVASSNRPNPFGRTRLTSSFSSIFNVAVPPQHEHQQRLHDSRPVVARKYHE